MSEDVRTAAFQEGKRAGLAVAAIAGSVVAFVSLLGFEKAILAIVLAILASRGAAPASRSRRLALMAIGIAIVYVLTIVVVIALYHARLGELIRQLHQIS